MERGLLLGEKYGIVGRVASGEKREGQKTQEARHKIQDIRITIVGISDFGRPISEVEKCGN